eukprot:2831185-Prymnesium_polylepis.1
MPTPPCAPSATSTRTCGGRQLISRALSASSERMRGQPLVVRVLISAATIVVLGLERAAHA